MQSAYGQIRDDVRAAEEVTPDETGWRVGGGKAWLHALATARTTCYEIDPTRSGDVAERLLGLDWNGRLVHDGWSVYEQFARAIHQQCDAHLLNRCKELLEVARRGAARFPLTVKRLLQQGLAVRDRFAEGEISGHGLLVSAGRLTARLERVVGGRFTHHGNRRLANFLSDHLCEVFAYLRHRGMAATNYRGEQSIRPAVVNRKVWGGNRTWLGAWAQTPASCTRVEPGRPGWQAETRPGSFRLGPCSWDELWPARFQVSRVVSSFPVSSEATTRRRSFVLLYSWFSNI
jgi:transposase